MKKSELVSMIKEEMKILNLPAQKVEEPKEPLKTLKQIKDWENKNPALPDEKTSVKQVDAIDESFGYEILKESLTKKDFISMVGYIKQAPQQHRSALIDFAVQISKADNPRFDEKKFRAACGNVTEAKHASDGVALYRKQDDGLIFSFDHKMKFLGAEDKQGRPYTVPEDRVEFVRKKLTKKPVKEADNDREKHLIYQRGMEMYFDQNGNFTSAYSEEKGNKVSPLPADIAAAKEKLKKQMTNENFMSNPTPQGQNVKQEQPEPKPLLPVKKAEFHKLIGQYNEYGKVLKRSGSLREMARKLGALATLAERTVVSEADDWFDAHTVKRNMKELKSYAGEFGKYAVEADQVMERVTALYDDMGRVLERYFEIYDVSESTQLGEAKSPKTEDCGVKKYTEPQDSFDVNEINEPSVFKKKPKDWSVSDQAKAIKYYVSLPLATLRKKQDDVKKKQREQFAAAKDHTIDNEPMMNLSVLDKVLAKSVDRKVFKDHAPIYESIAPMSAKVITLVYEQLNEQNKAKLRTLPVSRMAEICWKLLK